MEDSALQVEFTQNPLRWRERGKLSLLVFQTESGRTMGVFSDKCFSRTGLCVEFSKRREGRVTLRYWAEVFEAPLVISWTVLAAWGSKDFCGKTKWILPILTCTRTEWRVGNHLFTDSRMNLFQLESASRPSAPVAAARWRLFLEETRVPFSDMF